MNNNTMNKFSNFLLALLIAIFFIVLTFKIVENYNLKYVIFEKENVVKVKLELVSDFENEVLIFENQKNIEKILKIRNELRKYENPMCECTPMDLHFTVYTLEGREVYEGFKNIKLDDMLNDIYETEEIKRRTIPIFKFDENEISNLKIVNSVTGEEMVIDDLLENLKIEHSNIDNEDENKNENLKIKDTNDKKNKEKNERVIDYSKTEVIDSIIASMKNYYLKRKYINEEDVSVFDVYITLKNGELIEANIYNKDINTINIISIINNELLTNIHDLEYFKLTFKNKEVLIEDEDVFRDIFKRYVDYTTKDSIIEIVYKLDSSENTRVYFGSILLEDMSDELYSLFE